MMTPTTRRYTAALATLTLGLTLTACSDDEPPAPPADDTTTTTTAPPPLEERKATAADQVVDFYERLPEYQDAEQYLTEAATEIAHHSWINNYNSDLRALRQGDRVYRQVSLTVLGRKIVDFVEEDDDHDAAWTITVNICVEGQREYTEADGTVIDDPEVVYQGADLVTARFDGVNDAWMLTDYEPGDEELCAPYFSDDSDAGTATDG